MPRDAGENSEAGRESVYTIGYGTRSQAEFIAALTAHGVEILVDVRTAPYSRFRPEFSRDPLRTAVEAAGIRYVFQGEALGGKPSDPDCYEDGKVVYERIREKEWYLAGIGRLRRAVEQGKRIALMCSEGRPEECHRSKLIGQTLSEDGVSVRHIDEHGGLRSQADVILDLTGGQLSLFGGPSFVSRGRYSAPGDSRGEEVD